MTECEDNFITRDDLKDYIHGIHNFLRNKGAGYGQTGLKIFSVFYGLKLIQPYINSLDLTNEQKNILCFNELVKKSKTKTEIIEYIDKYVLEILWKLKNNKKDKNHDIGHFIFYQIPRDLKDDVWKDLIQRINKIPVGYKKERKVNLSGKVWEYFVGRDDSAISELGAYFTDRHITDFIFDRLKININSDNNIPTMIDPFGGSGGFTLGYANYMREKYDNINWINNVNNIYHFDMEESVINMTGLEMFAITGIFPQRKFNYIRCNTFNYEFIGSDNKLMYWNYVISNPPYGGDKIQKNADQIKRDKIINWIKSINTNDRSDKLNEQLKILVKLSNEYKKIQEEHQVKLNSCSLRIKEFAKKYNLESSNDKEACSLILFMDMLLPNGTCCCVIKEGLLFDSKYSKLRQVLIDNYNVTDIISIPQNAFENTSTKTSIIIFHNNGKTNNINFSELKIILEENDKIEIEADGLAHMIKVKDEIKEVIENKLCTASYKQLSKPKLLKNGKERYDYSLVYKNYDIFKYFIFKNNQILNIPEDYIMLKLSDVFNFLPKSKRNASFATNNGKYRFYTSSNNIKYCNELDIDDTENKYLIFGDGGIGSLFIDNQFSCSDHNIVCYTDDNYLTEYIYYYIKKYWKEFVKFHFNGSTIGNIKKENLLLTQIPIPKDINKFKSELESLRNLHQQILNDIESIPIKEKEIYTLIDNLIDNGKEGIDYDNFKFNNLIEYQKKSIKYKASDGKIQGKYKFYTSSQDKILFIDDEPLFTDTMLIMGRNGGASIHYDKLFSCEHDHVYVMKVNNLDTRYLYYYIKNNIKWFNDQMNGSTIKGTSKEILSKFNVNVLKSKYIKKNKLVDLFDNIDNIKESIENNKIKYFQNIDNMFEILNNSLTNN